MVILRQGLTQTVASVSGRKNAADAADAVDAVGGHLSWQGSGLADRPSPGMLGGPPQADPVPSPELP